MIVSRNTNIELLGNVRGRKKSLLKIVEFIKNYFDESGQSYNDYDFVIGHLTRPDDLMYLKEILQKEINKSVLEHTCDIGVTIGSHTGPTAIGATFIKKFESM